MGAALARITSIWNGLAGPSRRLIVSAAVIFLVALVVLWRLSGSVAYSNLVTGADPKDAAAITAKLRDAGIPYRLADAGATVQVPADKIDQARLDLAQSNLLGGGGVGWELFDNQGLGVTDFTQRVNLLRAREGELARTIGGLEPVRSATVKLAMPEERLFRSEQEPTTASVVLDLEPGRTLDPSQVRGIVNLVANAVPGLAPQRVTVADAKGNILSGAGADAEVAGVNARIAAEAEYERRVQSKLDAMLVPIVGPGKAVTQVDVVLNLDRVTTQRETFDPGRKVPLDRSETRETLKSTGGGSGGVAGASGNTPGATYPQVTGGSGDTDYEKRTTSERNGVDHARSDIVEAPGEVERQSISVQVSDEIPAAEIPKIQQAVEAAVGFQQGRDTISVQAVKFAAAPAGAAPGGGTASGGAPQEGGLDLVGIAKTAAAGIGVLLLLLLARRSLRRRQSDLERALPELLSRGPVPVAELDAPQAPPVPALEGQKKSAIQQQMEALALTKPDDVASLLRGWLLDRR
jgi:flagellar M-ring protein FliF